MKDISKIQIKGENGKSETYNIKDNVARENAYKIIDTTRLLLLNQDNLNLEEGTKIRTLGYYFINDGGEAIFIIEKTKSNILSIELNNGLFANYIFNSNRINVLMFGLRANANYFYNDSFYEDENHTIISSTNNSKLNDILSVVNDYTTDFDKNNIVLVFPKKNYYFKETIYIAPNISLEFNNSNIYLHKNFNGNYLIKTNMKSNNNIIIKDAHNNSFIQNFIIEDKYKNGINLIELGDSRTIKNIVSKYMGAIVKTNDNAYIDSKTIENINVYAPSNSNYQIEFRFAGDGSTINNVHFYGNSIATNKQSEDPYSDEPGFFINGIKIINGNVNISNIINGRINIAGESIANITNYHCERGQLLVQKSNVFLKSSMFLRRPNINTPIIFEYGRTSIIENVSFNNTYSLNNYNVNREDVDVSSSTGKILLNNCMRFGMYKNINENRRVKTGIVIKDKTFATNNYLYKNGNLVVKNGILYNIYSYNNIKTYNVSISKSPGPEEKWLNESGTYIYNVYKVYDFERKLGKQVATDISLNFLKSENYIARFYIDTNENLDFTYVIERTNSTNKQYAIINSIYSNEFFDNGLDINGLRRKTDKTKFPQEVLGEITFRP